MHLATRDAKKLPGATKAYENNPIETPQHCNWQPYLASQVFTI